METGYDRVDGRNARRRGEPRLPPAVYRGESWNEWLRGWDDVDRELRNETKDVDRSTAPQVSPRGEYRPNFDELKSLADDHSPEKWRPTIVELTGAINRHSPENWTLAINFRSWGSASRWMHFYGSTPEKAVAHAKAVLGGPWNGFDGHTGGLGGDYGPGDTRVLRVSGDAVCDDCGKTYREHPVDEEILDYVGRPFLRVGCQGESLKL